MPHSTDLVEKTIVPHALASWPAPPAATPTDRFAQVDRILARRAMTATEQSAADLLHPRRPRRARRWWIGGAR